MMPQLQNIIKVIADAYQAPSAGEQITEKELGEYIQSLDFWQSILEFSRTAYFVIDCKHWAYLHCSANARQVLGWDASEFMEGGPVFGLSRLLPEDLKVQGSIHPFMVDYLNHLPADEKPLHKFSFTSRVKHKDGKIVNLLQNNFFLKSDADGLPLLKIITFTDITQYKANSDIIFYISRIGRHMTHEIVMQKCFSGPSNVALTNREILIMDAAATGISNLAIAQQMGISLNTVKNFKKSLLRKLGCANTNQMVALATSRGMIPVKKSSDTANELVNNR